jgi:hypothetical protein
MGNKGAGQVQQNKFMMSNLFKGVKVLKFKTQEAYVYGETQLIYFSDVREHMKMNQHIELILFNVDSQNEKDNVGKAAQSLNDPRRASMASSVAAANGAAVAQ